MKTLNIKNYKTSDNLIEDIKRYFNEGVGIISTLNPYSDKKRFLCEFNPSDKLDIELMKEENYTELKKIIIKTCNFNNEKNIIPIKIKLEGFKEVSKQLDILIDKCKELNKINTTCYINNNFFVDNACNINDIAQELSEKLKVSVMKND